MNEAEWLTFTVPGPMILHLGPRASQRKLRHLCFAAVRRLWDAIPNEPLKHAVEMSERHADGLIDEGALGEAITCANRARTMRNEVARAAYDAARYSVKDGVHWDAVSMGLAYAAARLAVRNVPPTSYSYFEGGQLVTVDVPMNPTRQAWDARRDAEYAAHCDLIRDVFGNPFRPIDWESRWLSPAVVALGETIYVERAFDRMPELGDGLERAGCASADVLAHCRDGGPHVRGCWVVDLVTRRA